MVFNNAYCIVDALLHAHRPLVYVDWTTTSELDAVHMVASYSTYSYKALDIRLRRMMRIVRGIVRLDSMSWGEGG